MNISLEYVVRSKVIHSLINFPCSLFLEGAGDSMVVTFGRLKDNPEEIVCRHYLLFDKNYSELPNSVAFKVSLQSLFEDKRIIPDNYGILPYNEVLVDSELNDSYHPMDSDLYNRFTKNFFNTGLHKIVKRNWLWDIFCDKFGLPVNVYEDLTSTYTRHMQKYNLFVKERNKPNMGLWGIWKKWERKLLINKSDNLAATELIFSSLDE